MWFWRCYFGLIGMSFFLACLNLMLELTPFVTLQNWTGTIGSGGFVLFGSITVLLFLYWCWRDLLSQTARRKQSRWDTRK